MQKSRIRFAAAVLIAGFTGVGDSHGAEIFKWIGDDGVTHFSENPPESGFASLEVLEVVPKAPVPEAPQRYQSVLDVAKSIEDGRLQRERMRLERKKLILQNREAQQANRYRQEGDDDNRVYYPVYTRYPYKRYVRPYYRRHHGYPVKSPHRYGHKSYGRRGSAPRAVNIDR